MKEPWQSLRVGDRIRITHLPPEFLKPDYTLLDETRELYERLIERREILTVSEICDHKLPWVSYEQTMDDGVIVYHSLAVDDNSWELVTDS